MEQAADVSKQVHNFLFQKLCSITFHFIQAVAYSFAKSVKSTLKF